MGSDFDSLTFLGIAPKLLRSQSLTPRRESRCVMYALWLLASCSPRLRWPRRGDRTTESRPVPGPNGNIYVAVMFGNKIERFDTKAKTFTEWDLPAGARPHGLLVDRAGQVWYTGNGNGTIGHLDPATGKVVEHKAPSGGDPHTLVLDDQGVIWFTVQGGNRIGRLDRASGKITEYKTRGNPYGLAIDKTGNVWFCQLGGDRLGRLDPK